jgi:hypothetical protein
MKRSRRDPVKIAADGDNPAGSSSRSKYSASARVLIILDSVVIVLCLAILGVVIGIISVGITTTRTVSGMFTSEAINGKISSAISSSQSKNALIDVFDDPRMAQTIKGIVLNSLQSVFSPPPMVTDREVDSIVSRAGVNCNFDSCTLVRDKCNYLFGLLNETPRNISKFQDFQMQLIATCANVRNNHL